MIRHNYHSLANKIVSVFLVIFLVFFAFGFYTAYSSMETIFKRQKDCTEKNGTIAKTIDGKIICVKIEDVLE